LKLSVFTDMTNLQPQEHFVFIPEEEGFLRLFPHRYDYIWAKHTSDRPNWQTESRHPLSDRLILQGSYLYGVRFGAETSYAMLDIDRSSLYHPANDPLAIDRMIAALEAIGLVDAIAVTSSHSGGLHLYLPFSPALPTWQLAIALATLLENSGFQIKLGQLEVFPNYRACEEVVYKAHRLPLQMGSYLLNREFQPCYTSPAVFVDRWQFATRRNDINEATLAKILKHARRKRFKLGGNAAKFLNDLNAEIEAGWTGRGQTNHILGRIALRAYVFGHLLDDQGEEREPLTGTALVEAILTTARSLPGFNELCRHQPDLRERSQHWARAVEVSNYFPYGRARIVPLSTAPKVNWNKKQSLEARSRIWLAVWILAHTDSLPLKTRDRFFALKSQGIGTDSLYANCDLWHPKHLDTEKSAYKLIREAGGIIPPRAVSSDLVHAKSFPQGGSLLSEPVSAILEVNHHVTH
jgi:hypothetical protein